MPFRFTGRIAKLTFKLGPAQLTEAEHKVIAGRDSPERKARQRALLRGPQEGSGEQVGDADVGARQRER